jgi:hypothetical protein
MTKPNVEVELEPGLRNYRLPPKPSPEEVVEAIRQSWRFLLVAPRRIKAPLLAATYAAPFLRSWCRISRSGCGAGRAATRALSRR